VRAVGLLGASVLLFAFSGSVHAETRNGLRTQVIGGSPVAGSTYPATGALIRGTGDAHLACTATLIAPRLVLTAAHCIDDKALSFTLASDALAARGGIAVSRSLVHPDFSASVGTHDLAVAQLSDAVNDATPESLFEDRPLTVGQSVALVGYGPTTDEFAPSRVKNAASAVVEEVSDAEFVVGEAGAVENCGGDSGGPAFLETAEGRRVVGVASRALKRSEPCSGGTILTRLESERVFLEEALASLGDASTETRCSVRRIGGTGASGLAELLAIVACVSFATRR
jgi:secreted trypsin-like serine protease